MKDRELTKNCKGSRKIVSSVRENETASINKAHGKMRDAGVKGGDRRVRIRGLLASVAGVFGKGQEIRVVQNEMINKMVRIKDDGGAFMVAAKVACWRDVHI